MPAGLTARDYHMRQRDVQLRAVAEALGAAGQTTKAASAQAQAGLELSEASVKTAAYIDGGARQNAATALHLAELAQAMAERVKDMNLVPPAPKTSGWDAVIALAKAGGEIGSALFSGKGPALLEHAMGLLGGAGAGDPPPGDPPPGDPPPGDPPQEGGSAPGGPAPGGPAPDGGSGAGAGLPDIAILLRHIPEQLRHLSIADLESYLRQAAGGP